MHRRRWPPPTSPPTRCRPSAPPGRARSALQLAYVGIFGEQADSYIAQREDYPCHRPITLRSLFHAGGSRVTSRAVEARDAPLQLPKARSDPLRTLGVRVAVALALVLVVTLVTWIGRDGYRDLDETPVGFLDALYYATVSITTTGYGDITPVTTGTRLATTIIITPARILFLILLVGTTLEVLAEGSRQAVRQRSWRRRLHDHTIVCGYGTKGRSAIAVLRAKGVDAEQIVVIDPRPDHVAAANRAGHAGVTGDATRGGVLEEAAVADAAAVIVAVDRDDTAVLITLIAREHNKSAKISAAVREEENIHLLHQGGADSAILSSGATGRLLGFSTDRAARRRGARGPALRRHRPRHPRARGHHGGSAPARGDPLDGTGHRGRAGRAAAALRRPSGRRAARG